MLHSHLTYDSTTKGGIAQRHKNDAVIMVRPRGFEPLTCRLEGGCSIQLSYGRAHCIIVEGS